jgi:hypothetical protein
MKCDIVTQVSSSMSALDIILLQSSKGTVETAASINRFSVLDHASFVQCYYRRKPKLQSTYFQAVFHSCWLVKVVVYEYGRTLKVSFLTKW